MKPYLLLTIIFILFLTSCSPPNQICFQNNCYEIEIADTVAERSQGLMDRTEMDVDKGMLFIFPEEDKYSFWMKNTLIPLDIIWLDSKKEVVYIASEVQPCITDPCPSVKSDQDALYVLELNAGEVEKMGLEVGDSLEFLLE